ncbi:MAG: HDIG domain-containing protein [Chloroflexi bacterium]|nr:HDIG domain-containing protein [Chloroflexota bacterium]
MNNGTPGTPHGAAVKARMILFGLVLATALVGVLTFQFLPSRYQLYEGDVSPRDIKSPVKVNFVSQSRTKEERSRAESAVAEVYVQDLGVLPQQKEKLLDISRRISDARRESAPLQQKADSIRKIPGLSLSRASIDAVLAFDDQSWRAVTNETTLLLEAVLRDKVTEKQLPEAKAKLPTLVSASLTGAQSAVVVNLTENLLKPTFAVDQEATAKAKKEARDAVQPVRIGVEKGEIILRDGDVVKETDVEKLDAAGLRNPTIQWNDIMATALLVVMLVLSLTYYLYFFEPQILGNVRRLALVGLILVVTVLAAKLTIPGREMYAYLFPMAAASMLVSTLLSPQLAVVVGTVLAVLIGFIANFSLEMTTLFLVSGLVGLIGARRIERMNAFFMTGVAVAVANFAVILGFQFYAQDPDASRLATLGFISIVNGGLSAALTFGTFSLLGHIFGITTSLGLMELAHPTHPLFHRLLTQAPGTYHHSMVVANLAERAAQQIGADGMLCRVSAYYHDIGKVIRPYLFIENQQGQNVHDQLDPKSSAQLIASHIADGLELARQHGLPSKVKDIIQQHHGTHLVKYFYLQALQSAGFELVDQEEFRYQGPRPQTREAGIMMLADSVEASVRASKDTSSERIAELVQQVISERVADGQLDECDLTLRDLSEVRNTFVAVLQGIFHPRLEYPESKPPEQVDLAERVARSWIKE